MVLAPMAPVARLAELVFEDLYGFDLFAQAKTLPATPRDEYQALWRRLRAENAPLPILKGDSLLSAPISFFDTLLMSEASENWRKVARWSA
jgi:uncharacterized protein DUF3658